MDADGVTDALVGKLGDAIEPAMSEVAEEVRAEVQQLISDAYPPASTPGQPPHRRSGDYRDSWVTRTRREGDVVEGAAGTTEELGVWLEAGTNRMAARPHASVVADRFRPQIVDRLKSHLPRTS